MGIQAGGVDARGPDWWYDSWGAGDWLGTMFDQPLEVHAFLLGVFVGALLATVATRRHPRTTLTLTLVVVLFTFGTLETVVVCSDAFTACEHVRLKPWYFVGGFLSAHLFAIGALDRSSSGGPPTEDLDPTLAAPLAGLVVVALTAFAMYSIVSPRPVHPVTGLSTIGGLVGSVLGLAAVEWAMADDAVEPTFPQSLRSLLTEDFEHSLVVFGYGTVLGFGYPRLFWELGELVGRGDFLFGSILWAQNGLPSVVAYVFVVFLVVATVLGVQSRRENRRIGGTRFAALVLGHVVYAFCLFVASGYAGTVWFRLIPSA